jgi:serine/threonine protein kinase
MFMSAKTLSPGYRLGKYKVLGHIATGGMGTVYKAADEVLDRLVALKILDSGLADRPNTLERFKREAKHAARLSHKNIVTLYEYGQIDGMHFLALEYVDGIDLYDYIERKGQLAPEESRRILVQAVKALDHAFGQGIIHRDIKPSNFLLTRDRDRMRVKLTDMGLARTVDDDEQFRVTRAGSTVGTIDYLSPEQARNSASADIRSDIYSLGCTLYHMLAGNPPFSEGGLGERVLKHMEAEPPDVRQFSPTVSEEFWQLMRRMLAKKPEDRFQTPAELLQALKALPPQASDGEPIRLPRSTTPRTPSPSSPSGRSSDSGALILRDSPPEQKTVISRLRVRLREDDPTLLGLRPEHQQAAALQFERAEEARNNGNIDYAVQLLLSCSKLDPASILYRQTLREVINSAARQGVLGGWLASLSTLATRARLHAAKRAGQFRKVLEEGEEVLVKNPKDLKTQTLMAESADKMGLHRLAAWMYEEVRRLNPRGVPAQRALARLYERQQQYSDAIAVWEAIRKILPYDPEAARKIPDLAANDTIARGGYGR